MEIWSHLVINSLLFLFRKGKEEGNMEIPEKSKFQHFGILLKSVNYKCQYVFRFEVCPKV